MDELAKISEMALELQLREFNRLKKLEGGQVILASDLERAQRAVLTARTTKTQLAGQSAKLSKSKYRMEAAPAELLGSYMPPSYTYQASEIWC